MNIICRHGVEYTRFEVDAFYVQGDLFNTKCELVLHPSNKSVEINNFFWAWMKKRDMRDIIIAHENKQYILEGSVPMYVFSDNNGYVTNTKLKVSELSEITRKMKIENFLE
jgi:hypothetical protein